MLKSCIQTLVNGNFGTSAIELFILDPYFLFGQPSFPRMVSPRVCLQWKGINRKQSTRWQHLSQLKARAFFSLQIFLVVMKYKTYT
jgi:hypothetical protein